MCSSKQKVMLRAMAVAVTGLAASASCMALYVASQAHKVVGTVSEELPHDERYEAMYRDLAQRFDDTPKYESFDKDWHWVVVVTGKHLRAGQAYIAKTRAAVSVGDIVEVRVVDGKAAKSYAETSSLMDVLCKRADKDYETCRSRTEQGAWDASGKLLTEER